MDHRNAIVRQSLGKTVHIVIDRPLGYDHHGLIYPVNYGYIPGLIAGNGEEQDVYILGVSEPLREFDGIIIGAVLRRDDTEDKLIAVPAGMRFSAAEIPEAVHFQERFFDTEVIA